MTGCVLEVLEEPVPSDAAVELTAIMEVEPDSKTVMSGLEGGMYYPLWEAGDEIAVFADGDRNPTKFTLTSGEGQTKASFSGNRSGSQYHALYPYDENASVASDVLSLTLPQTQKYAKGSFGPGAYPMLGTGSSDGVLNFMNLCSVLKISMTGTAAIRNVTLTANDGKTFLSGPATVALTKTGTPQLKMAEGGSGKVTLDCKGLEITEDSPADVFIAIPSQTYKGGLTIEVDTYTETVTKTVTSDLTFSRSQIRTIPNFVLDSEVPDIIPEAIPDNEIWYTTAGESLFSDWSYYKTICGEPFDRDIVSHTYTNGIGKIVFDSALTIINDNAFSSYGNYTDSPEVLTSIYLPNSVKYIGYGAFGNQRDIVTFKVPDSVFEVESGAFLGTKVVKFIGKNTLPNGEGILVNGVLSTLNYDDSAEELVIPEGVIEIGESLTSGNLQGFCNRPNIKRLIISEGVRRIRSNAFWNCDLLEYVSLPGSLESVDSYIFRFCPNLKEFTGNTMFISEDGKCFLDEMYIDGQVGYGIQTVVKMGLPSDYVIPEGIVTIRPNAFEGIENLRSVTLPNSLILIEAGGEIFKDCPNFEFIYGNYASSDNKCAIVHNEIWCDGNALLAFAGKNVISYTTSDVKWLGDHVFAYQKTLEEIRINDEVTNIGNYCFSYCPNLRTIVLPANLEVMRYDPFIGSDNIESIYFRSMVPPEIEIGGVEQTDYRNLTIYVPEQALQLYQNNEDWQPLSKFMVGFRYDDLDYDYYISTDYSQDGKVTTLQTATDGNGIDIVLMGDAYSDRQIAGGLYESDMKYMYDNLFTKEPFKTHKDMFNVYAVNVVSATEGYDYGNTALEGFFGEGTYVGGNDQTCFSYALNAISAERMDEALIIVAMNADVYAGTCWMYYPSNSSGVYAGDYGSGPSIAYFPKGGDKETFAQLLHHEANGHGFAKLSDEYAYEFMGTIPSDEVAQNRKMQDNWGWWKNVDFTSDPSQVRWSHFLSDPRYDNEGLGVFEGGNTYWNGVWRPTENSIMRYNVGDFNAPSREAIYHRIHKLAYGDSWQYDYEDFVEYDAVNRSATASRAARPNYVERPLEPTSPPVVVRRSWKDAK